MIVKVVINGDSASISTHPNDKAHLAMVYPSSRVRKRFKESVDAPFDRILVGFFEAAVAVTKNVETQEEYELDVLELGERVPPPEEVW